jgi:hypothetical protein
MSLAERETGLTDERQVDGLPTACARKEHDARAEHCPLLGSRTDRGDIELLDHLRHRRTSFGERTIPTSTLPFGAGRSIPN